jgi:hypothetical protein
VDSFTQCKDSERIQQETKLKFGSALDNECDENDYDSSNQLLLADETTVIPVIAGNCVLTFAASIQPPVSRHSGSLVMAAHNKPMDENTDDIKNHQFASSMIACDTQFDIPQMSCPEGIDVKEITHKSSFSRDSTGRPAVTDALKVFRTYDTNSGPSAADPELKCSGDLRQRSAAPIGSSESDVRDELAKFSELSQEQHSSTDDAEFRQRCEIDNTATELNGSDESELTARNGEEPHHDRCGENSSGNDNTCTAAVDRPVDNSGTQLPPGELNNNESEQEIPVAAASNEEDQLFMADFDIAEVGGSNVSLFIVSYASESGDELFDDVSDELDQSAQEAVDGVFDHDRICNQLADEDLRFPVTEQTERG